MNDAPFDWTDEDDALVEYESLPAWDPSLFVDVFRVGLDEPEGDAQLRAAFVTPESMNSWGDFSRERALFHSGVKISMTAIYAIDAPDVAYVRLVETDQHTTTDLPQLPARAHVTLVWRPEIAIVPGSSWRIHHVGDRIQPDGVPRTVPGLDPRTAQ